MFMGKGCVAFISVGMAMVFLAGVVGQCTRGSDIGAQQAKAPASTVVTIGGKPLSGEVVLRMLDTQKAQMAQYMPSGFPPEQEAGMAGQTINTLLRQVAARAIAEKEKVDLSDAAITKHATEQLDKAVKTEVDRLIGEKKLKANPTAAEVDKAIKESFGQTVTEVRAAQTKNLEESLKDPARKDTLLNSIAEQLLLASYAEKVDASPAAVKRSYDVINAKRIFLINSAATDIATQANKIAGELKGGLKFEEAMNKYSQEPAQPGKTVSDNVTSVSGQQLTQEAYAPLASLKAGEVSPPIRTPEGISIYKVLNVKNEAPADFDKKKADYEKTFRETQARQKLDAQVDELLKSGEVRWQNKTIEALYDLGQLSYATDATQRNSKLKKIAVAGKEGVEKGEPADIKIGALVYYAALNQLSMTASATERAELAPQLADAVTKLLETTEDYKLRVKLIDAAIEAKNAAEATDNMFKSAQYNSDYSAAGQALYAEMQAKFKELKDKKLLVAEGEKQIEAEFQRWRKEKVAYEKAEAEAKAAAEAEAKKNPAPATGASKSPAPATGNGTPK